MGTVRLTVAQALVRFLANQYSERDGVEQRLIPGCFGIFGHGNVAGRRAGPAAGARDRLGRPAVLPRAQRAGHGARRRSATPRRATGCRRWPAPPRSAPARRTCSPAPRWPRPTGSRCCCWPATSSPPGWAARCCRSWSCRAGTTSRSTTRSARCRGSSTGCGGPSSCPRRCSARCGCSPTRPRPARSRSRCRRTSRPRRTTGPRSCSPSGSGTSPRPVPEPAALARAVAVIRSARRPLIVAGGGVIYSEATEELRALRRGHRHPGRRHPGRQGRDPLGPPAGRRRRRVHRLAGRQRAGPRGRRGDRHRHPVQRLHHRLADRVPEPGRAVRQPQRHRARRRQARRA